MFISIRDVPDDEKHLLYCSRLNAPLAKRRRRGSSTATGALCRALAIHGEQLELTTFSPPERRPQPRTELRCA